jgi:class 3 adenylate cyclase
MLLPYADRNIMVGAAASNGSAARYLAPLAATMGRWEEAERHFEAAVEMNARMGARPLVARTQIMYAEMLLRRNAPGDRVRALALLAEALETTQALGMSALVERAVKLKVEAQGISSSGVYTSIDAVAASVQRERPAISVHAAPDGTVTIMFSDIEGSTAMTERLGDQRWIEVLREHNAIVREQIAAHGGFEVKSEGDGFMVAFQSARKGLECAVGIQRALEARNSGAERSPSTSSGRTDAEAGAATDSGRTDGEAVRVRIGLHAGEVTKEGAQTGKEDYFGRNVIMAARVASQAHGGEILVSGVLKALVAGSDIPWGEARSAELKGLSGEHEIWPVAWSES